MAPLVGLVLVFLCGPALGSRSLLQRLAPAPAPSISSIAPAGGLSSATTPCYLQAAANLCVISVAVTGNTCYQLELSSNYYFETYVQNTTCVWPFPESCATLIQPSVPSGANLAACQNPALAAAVAADLKNLQDDAADNAGYFDDMGGADDMAGSGEGLPAALQGATQPFGSLCLKTIGSANVTVTCDPSQIQYRFGQPSAAGR